MLKTNCFIYKSFNFYYSLPTQFSLGFDCVHNTKSTYEFPIQASKSISKTQIVPNIIFITSEFFQQVQTVSEADTPKNQRVTKNFKFKTSTQKFICKLSQAE